MCFLERLLSMRELEINAAQSQALLHQDKKALCMIAVEQMSHTSIPILTSSCDSLPGILCIPAVFSPLCPVIFLCSRSGGQSKLIA